jgi:hypothetical protein
MQRPKFKTTEKAAWVFVNTRLKPVPRSTMERRTAMRCGYLTTASRLLGIPEAELPLPFKDEPMSKFVARVRSAIAQNAG